LRRKTRTIGTARRTCAVVLEEGAQIRARRPDKEQGRKKILSTKEEPMKAVPTNSDRSSDNRSPVMFKGKMGREEKGNVFLGAPNTPRQLLRGDKDSRAEKKKERDPQPASSGNSGENPSPLARIFETTVVGGRARKGFRKAGITSFGS